MMRLPLIRVAAAAASALALAGCVSLLPKSKPVDLYRFGQPAAAEAEAGIVAAPVGQVGVFRANAVFQRESAGDRLLTLTDGKAAYIAETRWVAPAAVLWDQALVAAFDADPGHVRLVSRGEPAAAAYILRVDVRNFETHYDRGAKAAPVILVRARGVLMAGTGGGVLSERIFEARVRAADNRVSAIVPAYDKAVAEVLGEVVAWTSETAKPA